jgi:hypothetical protein
MPLMLGRKMPELAERNMFFQKTRYTPVRHSDGSLRVGAWKLFWPMVDETMKKDIGRDNPSYEKGLVDPHWEMPLDTELPAYSGIKTGSPQLFNLEQDPSERHDLAAEHPQIVADMTKSYDSWFASVEADWKKSWAEIQQQDRLYWKNKPVPDADKLFKNYWRWDVMKGGGKEDPLNVFKGYWSQPDRKKK